MVEKVVQVPQLSVQEVVVPVPRVMVEERVSQVVVPQIQTVEKIVEVPQVQMVDLGYPWRLLPILMMWLYKPNYGEWINHDE